MKYGVIVAVIVILGFAYCKASQIVQNEEKEAVNTNETKAGLLEDVKSDEDDDLEGRGKKYKKHLLHAVAGIFLIKGAILPIAIGFLKLLVGKALLITVMALLLISVISLKKISSGGGHKGPQVINLVPHHGRDSGSQDLAYRHWLEKEISLR